MKPAMRRRIAEWEARGRAAVVSSGVVGSSFVVGWGFTLPRRIFVARNALCAGVVRACTRACSHCARSGRECVHASSRWERRPVPSGPPVGCLVRWMRHCFTTLASAGGW